MDTFAQRLRMALDIRGIKASDLSRATGITKATISRYLSGNFEAGSDRLSEIAKALNVSEVWLMGYDTPIEREVYTKNDQILDIVEKLKSDTDYYNLCVALAELSDEKLRAIFTTIFS